MQNDYPLTIGALLKQTEYRRSTGEVVYGNTRYTWSQLLGRVKALAAGLDGLGVKKGSKVAVVDLDTNRYLEAYFAVPMMGAVLHTVNIRLPPDQIAYTIAHAEDAVVLIADQFLPMAAKMAPQLKSVKALVTMSDSGIAPSSPFPNTQFYDDLVRRESRYEFPSFGEDTQATLFYTSGTTGLPKGVSFTHRQIVLHTMGIAAGLGESAIKLNSADVMMPLVPLFHVHGWGLPYLAGMWGMKTVLAGRYDAKNILNLMQREGVTFSDMVPTILNMVINYPGVAEYWEALSRWRVIIGGAALPKGIALAAMRLGIKVMTGYGLSETAPVLTLGTPTDELRGLPEDELLDKALLKTGVPVPLVEVRVVDQNMKDVPRDDKTLGEIIVRSPWTTPSYYKEPEKSAELWRGGWLHTGDLATIDERGYLLIRDRLKDVVKSGGEWISTLLLEDLLMHHESVLEAAVIGAKDEKWGERPIAIVCLKQGKTASEDELKAHLGRYVDEGKIAKFWLPEKIITSGEPLPKTSTGKLDKKPLREKYSSVLGVA
ncbi:MAG: long-chain fatty acid--CoA ligase [Nitrososphaerales archaeon]